MSGDAEQVRAFAAVIGIELSQEEAESIGPPVVELVRAVEEIVRRWDLGWAEPFLNEQEQRTSS